MSPPEIDEIFSNAMEQSTPEARATYLDKVCGTDLALRRRMERLLDAHGRIGSFLDSPVVGSTLDVGAPGMVEGPQTVLGPYTLLEVIGEGGMGVVYRAEQSAPVRRIVALKIIKPGMDTKQVIARFEAEQQALALMDHPNIARVLDAGVTRSDRPYFVMELVNGVPITNYCDENRLGINERLDLFMQVCHAVQHAHQKGVIHRDIKPSNVLVTKVDPGAPGVPKVIDFGISKAIGQSLTDKTLITSFAQLLGTPLYMSPEQAEVGGLDVDSRSDIYSLGVLLYELLTGSTPFDRESLHHAGIDEIRRLIRDQEPPKPSARLTGLGARAKLSTVSATRASDPRRLPRAVRGELDWITMKALEKDRRRRYETAAAFASDIQRFRRQQPVEAGPPSAWYRIRKLSWRHRGLILTTGIVTTSLLAGTVVSVWQGLNAYEARRQALKDADSARTQLAKFEMMNQFLVDDLLQQAEPSKNAVENQVTLLEVLDRAADRVGVRYRSQPDLAVSLRKVIGNAYLALASFEKAERQFLAIGKLARSHYGPDHPTSLDNMHSLAVTYMDMGNVEKALPLFQEALAGFTAKYGAHHTDTLNVMMELGLAYREAGDLRRTISFLQRIDTETRNDLGLQQRINASSLLTRRLGVAHHLCGQPEKGRQYLERAYGLYNVEYGEDSPRTLACMSDLARATWAAGEPEKCITLLKTVVDKSRRRIGPDHPETLSRMDQLAGLYCNIRDFGRGYPLLREAYARATSKLGKDHTVTIQITNDFACYYLVSGEPKKALPLLEDSLNSSTVKYGSEHPFTMDIIGNLAILYQTVGHLDKAVPLFEKVVLNARKTRGPAHPTSLVDITNLAVAYQRSGRPELAIPLHEETIAARRSTLGIDHPDTLASGLVLGDAYMLVGRTKDAILILQETIAGGEKRFGHGDSNTMRCKVLLALCYQKEGRMDEAILALRENLDYNEKTRPGSWEHGEACSLLGEFLLAQGKFEEAEPLLIHGYEHVSRRKAAIPLMFGDMPLYAGRRVLRLYDSWGKAQEASRWRARLGPEADDIGMPIGPDAFVSQ